MSIPSTPDRRVRIGFVLSHEQFAPAELIRLGREAEEAGFEMVWSSDHFQPWQDNEGHAGFTWMTLAALGQQTRHLTMGTGVTCPTFRYHPSIVAQAFASLETLYPSRIFLGVGAGEAVNEMAATGNWGTYPERAERLSEAVELIRALWSGERVEHHGRYYTTRQARLYTVPDAAIPIYIAASGTKSMRLAGEQGDGLITDGKRALNPTLRRAFAEGAQAAGKDPHAMPVLVEHLAVVGDQSEAEKGARLWRFQPKSWELYVGDPNPVSIQQRADQDISLESVSKDWPIGKDPLVHVRALQKLVDGGVSHIFVHSPQQDQSTFIHFYGEHVLPRLRSAVGAM